MITIYAHIIVNIKIQMYIYLRIYLDELLQVVVASPEAANLGLPFCSEPLQLLLIPAIHCRSCMKQQDHIIPSGLVFFFINII
jgi:hypothetical protein